ncbi:MAG: hypothetical protein ACE5JG_01585 [Planctomycetota bacterium]
MTRRRIVLAVALTLAVTAAFVYARGGRAKHTPGPYIVVLLQDVDKASTRKGGEDFWRAPYASDGINQLHEMGYAPLMMSVRPADGRVILIARK